MSVRLIEQSEGEGLVKNRFDSCEWWIIIAASPQGHDMAEAIEEKFYSKPNAARQFDVVMMNHIEGGPMMWAIYMAHKRWMPTKKLARFLGVDFPESGDLIITTDIPLAVVKWIGKTLK